MTRLTTEVSRDQSSLDADLMQRWRAGTDPAAVDQLVRRHGRMVLGVCHRILRDPADARLSGKRSRLPANFVPRLFS